MLFTKKIFSTNNMSFRCLLLVPLSSPASTLLFLYVRPQHYLHLSLIFIAALCSLSSQAVYFPSSFISHVFSLSLPSSPFLSICSAHVSLVPSCECCVLVSFPQGSLSNQREMTHLWKMSIGRVCTVGWKYGICISEHSSCVAVKIMRGSKYKHWGEQSGEKS